MVIGRVKKPASFQSGLPVGSFCRTSESCCGCLTPVACRMASAYFPGGRPGIVISTVSGDPTTPQKNCVSAGALRSVASRMYKASTVRAACWIEVSTAWIDPAMPSNWVATEEIVSARTAAALPDCTLAPSICADCMRIVRCALAICDCVMQETPKAGRARLKGNRAMTLVQFVKKRRRMGDFPSIRL